MLLVSGIGYFEVKVYGAEKFSKPERQEKTSIQSKQNQGGDGALPCKCRAPTVASSCPSVCSNQPKPARALKPCRKHDEERGVPPLNPRQPLAQHMIQHPESAHHRDTIRFVWHDISSYGQGGSGRAEEGGLPLNFIGWLSGLGSGGRTTTTRRRDRRRHRDGNGSPYSSLVCNSAAGSNLVRATTRHRRNSRSSSCYPTMSEEKKVR